MCARVALVKVKLEHELGIHSSQIPIEKFEFITKMRYQARQDEEWTEREFYHLSLHTVIVILLTYSY